VIDDRIHHGTAVLEPLEGRDRLRRDVRLTALTGTVNDVRGKERQIEQHEHGEQDTEHAHGAPTAVRRLHRRPGTPAPGLPGVGREAAGAARLGGPPVLVDPRGLAAAGGIRVDGRRQVAGGRREESRLDLGGPDARAGGRVPDLRSTGG